MARFILSSKIQYSLGRYHYKQYAARFSTIYCCTPIPQLIGLRPAFLKYLSIGLNGILRGRPTCTTPAISFLFASFLSIYKYNVILEDFSLPLVRSPAHNLFPFESASATPTTIYQGWTVKVPRAHLSRAENT